MTYVVRDFNVNDLQDAERLAAMFNDFDSAWPGGFTRGIPETAEHVQRQMRRSQRLAICVVEKEDEFVGFCDLQAQPGQTDIAYIPLLGARLSHHGKGVGKMLLRELVRRATEHGYRQVTLHTWAGNTKAVPLYKKTGFNWVPETNVFMRNFIPTALTIPQGKVFFAERDWYTCFEREIVVAPDDVKWKGMKVFPYRFREGDDFLNLVFDSVSERLTAIETPAYSVSCSIPVEEAAAGETVSITWEIINHGERPLEVVLLTEADSGLGVSVQEHLRVERESPLIVTRDLTISAEATPRREGEAAHRVRSTLLLDGQPVVLETGVKVVRPVEIEYYGQGLFPGREEKIQVILQSHLDRPITGRVALDPHPALICPEPARDFTLPARMKTQCELTVTAREAGVFPTQVRFEAEELRGSRPATFRAYGSGGALASIDPDFDETAVLESPELRIITNLRGGWTWVQHNSADRGVMGMNLAELGPPFPGWRVRPPVYSAHIDRTADGTALTLIAPSPEQSDLTVERTLTLLGGGLIRMDYRVCNTSDQPTTTQLRCGTHGWLRGYVTMPLPDGLIREAVGAWGDYPAGRTDVLPSGAKFTENWAACEEDGLVCGFVWSEGAEQDIGWGAFPNLTFDLGELPAHSLRALPPLYLVVGSGNWETVRGWWRRLQQPSGIQEAQPPEPLRVLEVRTEPSPALVTQEMETVPLALYNRRGKTLAGTLTVTGEAFEAKAEFSLAGVDREHPFLADLTVTPPEAPSAGFLQAALDTGPSTETFRIPIVRLSTAGDMRISEGESGTFTVENGLLTLRVAPHFLGALTALERGGVNHLFSVYPEARPFQWANPWFGGVHPFLGWPGDPRLPREKFTGGPVERTGERGLRWKGVWVACQPEHKDLRWLHLEVAYLTLPGSNVVAIVSRWTNHCSARMETPGQGGIGAWLQVGGTRQNAILHWEHNGERRHRRRGGFGIDGQPDTWAAVENPDTGDHLLIIATEPRAHAGFEDFAEEGPHLIVGGPVTLEPHETKETLAWLILGRDMSQIDAYAGLAKARRLP
jgi:ribosomal protein S18 acetylase RimI-like enzyme